MSLNTEKDRGVSLERSVKEFKWKWRHFICSAPLSSTLRVLDSVNGLVCSTGDQTWYLNVYLHNDKACESQREPQTLSDEMGYELVKYPSICH